MIKKLLKKRKRRKEPHSLVFYSYDKWWRFDRYRNCNSYKEVKAQLARLRFGRHLTEEEFKNTGLDEDHIFTDYGVEWYWMLDHPYIVCVIPTEYTDIVTIPATKAKEL